MLGTQQNPKNDCAPDDAVRIEFIKNSQILSKELSLIFEKNLRNLGYRRSQKGTLTPLSKRFHRSLGLKVLRKQRTFKDVSSKRNLLSGIFFESSSLQQVGIMQEKIFLNYKTLG